MRKLVALVALILVAWGSLWAVTSSKLDKGVFESALTQSLGIQLKMERVALTWQGRIEFFGVRLNTREGRDIGSIRHAVSHVETTQLARGKFVLLDLTLEGMELRLDRDATRELAQLPPSQKPRSYPIHFRDCALVWEGNGRFGPIEADLGPQASLGQLALQATLANVTRVSLNKGDSGLDFTLATQGGAGLPASWCEAFLKDDRLEGRGRLEGGSLSFEGKAERAQLGALDFQLRLKQGQDGIDFVLQPKADWKAAGQLRPATRRCQVKLSHLKERADLNLDAELKAGQVSGDWSLQAPDLVGTGQFSGPRPLLLKFRKMTIAGRTFHPGETQLARSDSALKFTVKGSSDTPPLEGLLKEGDFRLESRMFPLALLDSSALSGTASLVLEGDRKGPQRFAIKEVSGRYRGRPIPSLVSQWRRSKGPQGEVWQCSELQLSQFRKDWSGRLGGEVSFSGSGFGLRAALLDLKAGDLRCPKVALEGKASSGPVGWRLRGDVKAPQCTFQKREWGPLDVALSWPQPSFQAKLPRLGLSLGGPIAGKELKLAGSIKELDLALLAGDKATGRLSGSVKVVGTTASPKAHLKGSILGLRVGQRKFSKLPLEAHWSPEGCLVSVPTLPLAGLEPSLGGQGRLQASWIQSKPAFTLSAARGSWKGKPLPPVKISGDLLSLKVTLTPPERTPIVLTGTLWPLVTLKGRVEKLDLEALRPYLPEAAQLQGRIDGNVTVTPASLEFAGQAENLSLPQSRLGPAKVSLKWNDGKLLADLKEMSANEIGALGHRYPGIQGKLQIHAEGTFEELHLNADLTQARFRERDFPEVRGQLLRKGDWLYLESVRIATAPPLNVTGQYGLHSQQLKIQVPLSGQSTEQLADVVGAAANPEVQARLNGPLHVGGTVAAPEIAFRGEASEMKLRGVAVGSGTLQVEVAQQLQGQLTFREPVDASAFGKLGGVPGLVKVTGVRFGGTPSSPTLDPQLQGPRLQVVQGGGGGIKLGPFRLR